MMIKTIKTVILCVSVYVIVFGLFIHYHEMAHIQVAKWHGCEDIKSTFLYSGMVISCEKYSDLITEDIIHQERLIQSWIEVIGYHLVAPLFLGCMFFVGWIVMKELR